MTILTYTQQLEAVQAAIAAIEGANGAQKYRMPDGQEVTKADLETLYKREERLMVKYQRQQAGRSGPRVRYVEVG